nr:MAG TPA: hypothetical protein [Caudoviricetes sp.]
MLNYIIYFLLLQSQHLSRLERPLSIQSDKFYDDLNYRCCVVITVVLFHIVISLG